MTTVKVSSYASQFIFILAHQSRRIVILALSTIFFQQEFRICGNLCKPALLAVSVQMAQYLRCSVAEITELYAGELNGTIKIMDMVN